MTYGHLGEPIAGWQPSEGVQYTATLVWNTGTLQWEKATGGAVPGTNVTVTNFPATYPVTGTFWQATQPVSISGTVPVSGTITANQGTSPWVGTDNDAMASGTITAIDSIVPAPAGGGQMVSGASTAGSIIAIAIPGGKSGWAVGVAGGTWTTTLYFEESVDSTNGTDGNWISVLGRVVGNSADIIQGYTQTTNQYIRGSLGSANYFRVRAVGGGITSGPLVTIRAGGVGPTFLMAPLPAGDAVIGHVIVDSGAISVSGTVAATQSGAWTVGQTGTWNIGTVTTLTGITNPVAVTGTFWQAIQPVSGTVTANISGSISNTTFAATQSGTWTDRIQDSTGNALTSTGNALDVNLKTSSIALPVTGPLTDTQLRATPVPVSGSFTASTTATSTAADPVYVEGAASNLSQDLSGHLRTVDNLAQVGGVALTLGTKFANSALPIAVDSGTTNRLNELIELNKDIRAALMFMISIMDNKRAINLTDLKGVN